MENSNEPAVLVLEHTIKKGYESRYEMWLADVFEATKDTPGFVGREILPPDGPDRPYRTVVRFQTGNHLYAWLDSTDRTEFVSGISDILESGDRMSVKTGSDLWMSKSKTPGRYKLFLVTILVIFPVTQIVPKLFEPILSTTPVLKNTFVTSLILNIVVVALMSFMIMPQMTHWLRRWLFRSSSDKEDPDLLPIPGKNNKDGE